MISTDYRDAPILVQKGSMGKRVIVIALLLVVAIFAYVGYHSYDAKRAPMKGEVYSNGVIRRGGQAETEPDADAKQPSTDADPVVYPAANGNTSTASSQDATASAQPQAAGAQVTETHQAAANVPATDTISPNPPNGMAFAGSGRYQLYRQGNITWRLDTNTGRACVIFATDEEWARPKVYRAGCGSH